MTGNPSATILVVDAHDACLRGFAPPGHCPGYSDDHAAPTWCSCTTLVHVPEMRRRYKATAQAKRNQ